MAIRPIVFAAAALAAGAAHAQTVSAPAAQTLPSAIPAAALNAAVSARFSEAGAQKAQGMARTSLDHRFAAKEASGAFGFLCGRPDSLDARAASSAYGSDPHGRFLGAKFSLAFR
jgi:hypothetical protein